MELKVVDKKMERRNVSFNDSVYWITPKYTQPLKFYPTDSQQSIIAFLKYSLRISKVAENKSTEVIGKKNTGSIAESYAASILFSSGENHG